MDFSKIWELVAPYADIIAIVAELFAVIFAAVKVIRSARKVVIGNENNNSTMLMAAQKAMPKELTISVNNLVKTELKTFTEELKKANVKDVAEHGEKMNLMLELFANIKTIPDKQRARIDQLLGREERPAAIIEIDPEVQEIIKPKKSSGPVE